jgi:hypothetical protein
MTSEPEEPETHAESDRGTRLCRRTGWTSVALWACVGLALEAAHGLKLAGYLDDALTRELCTLAHAHGVGLAIVVLLVGEHGLPRLPREARHSTAMAVVGAAIAIPLAFLASSVSHPEGDPGLPIWIVPFAAVALIAALARIAAASWRE